MKRQMILIAALALFPVSNVLAHEGMDMGGMTAAAATSEGVGVVESVDQAKGIVTLSHEPIASLNWPAMTMDFAVEDKALFKKLLAGKKVKFQFVKQGNRYVVKGVK
jgi:Cu/Ag efflux protein CusF